MALVPNTWEDTEFLPAPSTADWTEGMGTVSVRTGYYENPSRAEERIIIEQTKSVKNQNGTEIRRDEELFTIELPGAPPSRYERKTYSAAYLPGLGRNLRLVENEVIIYWAFTPWTHTDNLGRTRFLSGLCVYDLPVIPNEPTDDETKDAAEEEEIVYGPIKDRIVQSGRLWSGANEAASVPRKADAGQVTIWVDNVVVEHELVEEEQDKWTLWNLQKDGLRPQQVSWSGPRHVRKESFSYRLPVPVQPPQIDVNNRDDGVEITAKKGGAKITNPFFGPAGTAIVRPDRYHFYRRTVAEPERDADPNLYDQWESPPIPDELRAILEDTDVTDFDGAPAEILPTAQTWDEPHDAEPEDPPRDTEFRRVGTVDNVNGKHDEGEAIYLDTDVEDTGEYEYYATAEIGEQESNDSNHETITFSGAGSRRYRIQRITDEVIEAIAPDDPALPPLDYGEVIELEIPMAVEDPMPPLLEVADRQFAANRGEDFKLRLDVQMPLLGLEWGQSVRLPNVQWETFGVDLHVSTQTESDKWMLVGFERRARRSDSGTWDSQVTVVHLSRRPDPQ